jgi:hypothetical protein
MPLQNACEILTFSHLECFDHIIIQNKHFSNNIQAQITFLILNMVHVMFLWIFACETTLISKQFMISLKMFKALNF